MDLDLLHHHLARALLHLHGQPPLFNFVIGIALKLAGDGYGAVLLALQLLLGGFVPILAYMTLRRLQVNPVFSFIVATLLLLNPAAILSEFDALYTELVYAMLTGLAYALASLVVTQQKIWLSLALSLALLLSLTRATYQWVWLAMLCALLWWLLPLLRRTVLRTSLVFLALSILWPAKNLILFHHFTSSTWLSYSLSKHWHANDPTVSVLVWEGRLPTYEVPDGAPDEVMNRWLAQRWATPPTGYPELDSLTKSVGGFSNWNSLALLHMREAQNKDVHLLLKTDPRPFFQDILWSSRLYFEPASRYFLYSGRESFENYQHLAPWTRRVDRAFCNLFGLPAQFQPGRESEATATSVSTFHISPWQYVQSLSIGAILINALAVLAMLSLLIRRFWRGALPRRQLVILLSFTIAWVLLVTNLAEIGENMRFRFETHVLVCIVAAVFLQQLVQNRRTRRT